MSLIRQKYYDQELVISISMQAAFHLLLSLRSSLANSFHTCISPQNLERFDNNKSKGLRGFDPAFCKAIYVA